MPGGDDPRDPEDFEQARSKLSEGLKSCRSMLSDYRAVIGRKQGPSDNDNSPREDGGSDDKSG